MTESTLPDQRLRPPIPTFKNPHAQVDWIWRLFLQQYKNEETRENYRGVLSAYKQFLKHAGEYDERLLTDPRFYLSVYWDHFTIHIAGQYWSKKNYASKTLQHYIRTLTAVVNFAVERGLVPVSSLIPFSLPVDQSKASPRIAYTNDELKEIRSIINGATANANRIAYGYTATGVGENPCLNDKGSLNRAFGSKWATWENVVWYFENILNCQPRLYWKREKTNISGLRKFYRAARTYYGGVENVWLRLGVCPIIGRNHVVPLAMKLAMETGLNAGVILNLKRDCYQKQHPLTGLPYIRYYKERSTGEKDLHLPFFDQDNQAELHLRTKQSEIIRRTINLISTLTQVLVKDAREEDKPYLFLFQKANFSKVSKKIGENGVMRITSSFVKAWAATERRRIEATTGQKGMGELSLSRFRATKITQLVCDGHDIFNIQAIAGHASLVTTARYITAQRLEVKAQCEVTAALSQIHRNSREFALKPLPYAQANNQHSTDFIYKGLICDCKNAYDPPKVVKNLSSYQPGQSCTYWNMCLFCPNIIITKKHLPSLMTFARDIKLSFSDGNLMHVPNTILYQKILTVIQGIFNEFPKDDLQKAADIAELEDFYFDGVVYRGVDDDNGHYESREYTI